MESLLGLSTGLEDGLGDNGLDDGDDDDDDGLGDDDSDNGLGDNDDGLDVDVDGSGPRACNRARIVLRWMPNSLFISSTTESGMQVGREQAEKF
jgi:hypothetical protein